MSSRGFAEVCLKLLGVYWTATAILSLPSLAQYWASSASAGQAAVHSWLLTSVLIMVVYLAVGVSTIRYAKSLALRLVPETSPEIAEAGMSSEILQGVALSILGIYFVARSLLGVPQHIFSFAALGQNPEAWAIKQKWLQEWGAVSATGLELVVGVALFFGGKPLARLWHRLRPVPASDSGEEGL